MALLSPRIQTTLQDLEAALASSGIPPRIAHSCERLAEKLRRPIRVGLIGFEIGQRKRLLADLLGIELLPDQMVWPTVEIGFAEQPCTRATLADRSTFATEGLPRADLLEREPVFLQIAAPIEVLRRVTLLNLAASEDLAEQSAALRWAARRVDFALWCTRNFSAVEARIWNAAPPELKNHSYLVVFTSDSEASSFCDRNPPDFERVIHVPGGTVRRGSVPTELQAGVQELFGQLAADIDDALGEDLDAARLLLHRCGQRIGSGTPVTSPVEAAQPAPAEPHRPEMPDAAEMVDLLSEPLIFLKRRARDLFESLEWHDPESPGWAGEVLERCCELTDGLRDRTAAWPEEDGPLLALRGLVDDASDMATLLQIEGGRAQAQDAAALLCQLRSAFEANLTRPAIPLN